MHPYTETIAATLVNSDDGELFAEGVRRLLQTYGGGEDSGEQVDAPTSFQVTSYVQDKRNSSGDELASIRKIQMELRSNASDRPSTTESDHHSAQ